MPMTVLLDTLKDWQALVKVIGSQRITARVYYGQGDVRLFLENKGRSLLRFCHPLDEGSTEEGSAAFDFANAAKVFAQGAPSVTFFFGENEVCLKMSSGTSVYCPIERSDIEEPSVFDVDLAKALKTAKHKTGSVLDSAARKHILRFGSLFGMSPEAPLQIQVAGGLGRVCATNGMEAVRLTFSTSLPDLENLVLPELALRLASAIPDFDLVVQPTMLFLARGDIDVVLMSLEPEREHTPQAIDALFLQGGTPVAVTTELVAAFDGVALVSDSARIVPSKKGGVVEGYNKGARAAKHAIPTGLDIPFFDIVRILTALKLVEASSIKQSENALMLRGDGVDAAYLYASEASRG
jgi:hypothetical protein